MTLLLAWQLPQARINSSVLALLPQEEADTPLAKWQSPLAERLDRQLVWLIHAPAGAEAARWWQQQLGQLQGITQVVGDEPSLARQWAGERKLDAIVSTDGDGDRPLVADETGRFLRGDLVGALTARFLGADAIVTPVTSNSALANAA